MSASFPAEIVCAVASQLAFVGRVRLSHVCSLWRAALLGDALLWNHIVASPRVLKKQSTYSGELSRLRVSRTRPLLADDLSHILARTRNVSVILGPLRLPDSEKDGWAVARVIVTHLHHIAALDLQCASARTSNVVLKVFSDNWDNPAPLLKRFAFTNSADAPFGSDIGNPELNLEQRLAAVRMQVVLPGKIFAGGAPQLTTLELENVHLASNGSNYASLASVARFDAVLTEPPQYNRQGIAAEVSLSRVMPRLVSLRIGVETRDARYSLAPSHTVQMLRIVCPEGSIDINQWRTLTALLHHQRVREAELVSCSDRLFILELVRDLGGWGTTLDSFHFVCNHSGRAGTTHTGRSQNIPYAQTNSIRVSNEHGLTRTFRRMSHRIGDPIGVHFCTGLRSLEVDDVLLPTLDINAVLTWMRLWKVTIWLQYDLDARMQTGQAPLSLQSTVDALAKVLDPRRSPSLGVLEINAYNGEAKVAETDDWMRSSTNMVVEDQDDAMNVHAIPQAGQTQPLPRALIRCIASRASQGQNRALSTLRLRGFYLHEDDLREMEQHFSEIEMPLNEERNSVVD